MSVIQNFLSVFYNAMGLRSASAADAQPATPNPNVDAQPAVPNNVVSPRLSARSESSEQTGRQILSRSVVMPVNTNTLSVKSATSSFCREYGKYSSSGLGDVAISENKDNGSAGSSPTA